MQHANELKLESFAGGELSKLKTKSQRSFHVNIALDLISFYVLVESIIHLEDPLTFRRSSYYITLPH